MPDNDVLFPDDFLDQFSKQTGRASTRLAPNSIGGVYPGHGTKMASIAAGKRTGIAPNADLFLVKAKGNYNFEEQNEQGETVRSKDRALVIQPAALQDILDTIREHIVQRLRSDPDTKSVVNMSWGMLDRTTHSFDIDMS